jgi:hypothetical protein
MTERNKIVELKPHPASKREAFMRRFNSSSRKEAAARSFKYRPDSGTCSPRKTARDIKAAVEDDTPLSIFDEIESAVFMMALCAGNLISLDAPLDTQFLAAHQRLADFYAGRTLLTPEETARQFAMIAAARAVSAAVADYNLWRKGGAR